MKYYLPAILLSLTYLCYACSNECRMKIEDFTVINKLDDSLWGWQDQSFARYYLISNYKNHPSCQSVLDSMACAMFSDTGIWQKNIGITFYKKSRITNNEKMLENDRYLDRYSNVHDVLISYGITLDSLGGSMGKTDYFNKLRFSYSFIKELDTLKISKRKTHGIRSIELVQDEINDCFIELVMPKNKKIH